MWIPVPSCSAWIVTRSLSHPFPPLPRYGRKGNAAGGGDIQRTWRQQQLLLHLQSRMGQQQRRLQTPVTRHGAITMTKGPANTGTTSTTSSLTESPLQRTRTIPDGSIVTIDCQLVPVGDFVPERLFDGVVLRHPDSDPSPLIRLQFVLGWGNYLPGLHDLVSTMSVGECLTNISLDAGWGAHREDLVITVTWDTISLSETDRAAIQPGVSILLSDRIPCVVTNVTDTSFTIDANPPLAGSMYHATVTLLNVEEGPVVNEGHEEQNQEVIRHNNQQSCSKTTGSVTDIPSSRDATHRGKLTSQSRYGVATFALGCFWGGELAFMREPGVVGTAVGYTQGHLPQPSYEQVCSGTTGHTEAIVVIYDPDTVPYQRLVKLAMDRLGENKYLLNQVGNDKGPQYRHGVYYHTPEQGEIAQRVLAQYGTDCVTECLPAKRFWFAEEYHQQYLLKGGQSARKNDDSVIRCYG